MSHSVLDHTEQGLVIFCGAGVSMVPPTCLPSWWQMNAQVVQALSREIEPFSGPERAADWAKQINVRRDKGRFPPEFQAEIISKHYGASYFKVLECLDGDEPNSIHLAIAALAKSGHVRAIVTSNFDRVLEVAFRKLGVPLDVYFQASHFDRLATELEMAMSPQSRCRLLKLHGSVEDHRTLVDTLAQRMRGLSSAICSCLQQLLRSHYWLFLGYSGRDLEGNPQYLCLQSEGERAVGFSWLVRESAKDEPIEAVVNICKLYGDRAEAPRGDLPTWFLEQFSSLLPEGCALPSTLSEEELDRRKQKAAQAIVDHAREWSAHLGSVRAALALADMLEQSIANPHAAQELLTAALNTLGQHDGAYVAVANGLVNTLVHASRFDEAMKLAEKALPRISLSDEEDRIALVSNMGLIEHERGDYRQALERFEQAYESSARLNDEDRKSVALHNRAMALVSLGRPEEAMSCYEEELGIVERSGDAIAQAQTLNNMGDLLNQQDRYDEAIDVLQRSIALRQRLGDDRGVAICLGNIAAAHRRQGEFARAKAAYERILATFERIGDRPHQVTTILNLGRVAKELNNLDEAEGLFRQATAIATEYGLEIQRAGGLQQLGSLCCAANRSEEAERLFDEALAIYRKSGDKSREADALNDVGILLWRTARLDTAKTKFEQAIAIRELLKQPAGLCEAIGNLALVYADKGESDEAMELLKRKLAIAVHLNARSLIANAHYNIGTLLHNQGAIADSLDSFDTAQRLYHQMGQINKAIGILAAMGEICGRQGKVSASLRWFDQAIPLATGVDQKTTISTRLVHVLEVLLQNGYPELTQEYVQRLEALGAKVKIEKT
jgi:tetratricopeptide (TPR) repeat protein